MDEEVEKEEGDRKWEAEREERRKEEEEKLRKNREKREKARARKGRGKKGGPVGGMDVDGDGEAEGKEGNGGGLKKRLGPAKVVAGGEEEKTGEVEEKADGKGGEGEEGGITIHDDD